MATSLVRRNGSCTSCLSDACPRHRHIGRLARRRPGSGRGGCRRVARLGGGGTSYSCSGCSYSVPERSNVVAAVAEPPRACRPNRLRRTPLASDHNVLDTRKRSEQHPPQSDNQVVATDILDANQNITSTCRIRDVIRLPRCLPAERKSSAGVHSTIRRSDTAVRQPTSAKVKAVPKPYPGAADLRPLDMAGRSHG